VSYSWVDPHFAVLYARREEERLAERLASCLRRRAACEPGLGPEMILREPTWAQQEVTSRGNLHLV
jgi:hypothetical protein